MIENIDYPQGLRKVFKENFAGTITADEIFNQGEKDFRIQITKIKNSGMEAVFFVPQSGTTMGLAIKQMRELGIENKIYTVVAASDAVSIAGDAIRNTVFIDTPEL